MAEIAKVVALSPETISWQLFARTDTMAASPEFFTGVALRIRDAKRKPAKVF
jgi:hypothetical protein